MDTEDGSEVEWSFLWDKIFNKYNQRCQPNQQDDLFEFIKPTLPSLYFSDTSDSSISNSRVLSSTLSNSSSTPIVDSKRLSSSSSTSLKNLSFVPASSNNSNKSPLTVNNSIINQSTKRKINDESIRCAQTSSISFKKQRSTSFQMFSHNPENIWYSVMSEQSPFNSPCTPNVIRNIEKQQSIYCFTKMVTNTFQQSAYETENGRRSIMDSFSRLSFNDTKPCKPKIPPIEEEDQENEQQNFFTDDEGNLANELSNENEEEEIIDRTVEQNDVGEYQQIKNTFDQGDSEGHEKEECEQIEENVEEEREKECPQIERNLEPDASDKERVDENSEDSTMTASALEEKQVNEQQTTKKTNDDPEESNNKSKTLTTIIKESPVRQSDVQHNFQNKLTTIIVPSDSIKNSIEIPVVCNSIESVIQSSNESLQKFNKCINLNSTMRKSAIPPLVNSYVSDDDIYNSSGDIPTDFANKNKSKKNKSISKNYEARAEDDKESEPSFQSKSLKECSQIELDQQSVDKEEDEESQLSIHSKSSQKRSQIKGDIQSDNDEIESSINSKSKKTYGLVQYSFEDSDDNVEFNDELELASNGEEKQDRQRTRNSKKSTIIDDDEFNNEPNLISSDDENHLNDDDDQQQTTSSRTYSKKLSINDNNNNKINNDDDDDDDDYYHNNHQDDDSDNDNDVEPRNSSLSRGRFNDDYESSHEIIIKRKKKKPVTTIESTPNPSSNLILRTPDYSRQPRRSTRNRVRPLDYWRGERIMYRFDNVKSDFQNHLHLPTVVGVSRPSNEVPLFKPKRRTAKNKKKEQPSEEVKTAKLSLKDILNLSIHAQAANMPHGALTNETDLVKKLSSLKFKESEKSKGVYTTIIDKNENDKASFGMVKFDAYAKKKLGQNGAYTTYFTVLYGVLLLDIDNEPSVVETGSYFKILPHSSYHITNIREDEALLQFSVIKE